MAFRGVLQSMYAGAERSALGGSRETMTHPSTRTKDAAPAGTAAGWDEGRRRLPFTLGLITAVLSLCSGLATYVILTGLTPIKPTDNVVVVVLFINLVPVLAMIAIIAWQVTGLWLARQRQAAGAQLHVRIVSLLSVIALVPAILLAIFASISLGRGLDYWFSVRTQAIVQNSMEVAEAYLEEHEQVIRANTVAMARYIDEGAGLARSLPQKFGGFLSTQAAMNGFPVAYLIDGEGKVLATAAELRDLPYKKPPEEVMARAKKGPPVPISLKDTNMVGAIKSLNNFTDTYLYVMRPVNLRVLQHLSATRANVAEYQGLEQRRTNFQMAYGLIYLALALTLLASAIWIGMWFANRLVAPIRQLMGAAEQISRGNLGVNVDVRPADGDLAVLGSTFNTMTAELKSQRDELIGANSKLDERRQFMEAVLSGVTAGVVGVDSHGVVTLVNRSAETLLEMKEAVLVGQPLAKAVPEFAQVLKRAQKQGKRLVTDQVTLRRQGSERNFAVRVTSEGQDQDVQGFVVTFDDMTELVSAQRSTAWADVARRIAHEIKNPLTPIQLSAERIRRKYGNSITKDREVFDQCTNTIIRQVSDIGRMVDEFSAFARMPKPVMERHDVRDIVREAVFLFQVSRPDIAFELDLPETPVVALSDRRLLSQAVTNLVKNASEAIDSAVEGDASRAGSGRIVTKVRTRANRVQISVLDNGCGLPAENRERLVEPYMTTRTKGTGLGLAIVQRITEQHAGTLTLADGPKRNGKVEGASVRIDFPTGEREGTRTEEVMPEQGASVPAPAPEHPAEAEEEEGVTHGV
ncbi:MAG TPA: PAS domain-containing sensor histidine kinase [Methyloceanibacter sp.]|jgi:two-component system, NtrC family, nitrogen regulation sensor histidine kinase NtrY|nr:PAS domain-containing sensor histidine kinase [Methyloceanibacter sp.]